jgi:lysophospholipase L1-like esterase
VSPGASAAPSGGWLRAAARRACKPLVACAASIIGLLLAEGLCRIVFDRIDYLEPVVVPDEVLGHRIVAGSAGHDAWGYRNRAVPERSAIVAIGDSQTYGVAASARTSWPAWLDRLQDEPVYNLALGGYGPVQYAHMLEHNGLRLRPSTVIVGVYFGNDFVDAWYLAYAHEPWKALRRPELVEAFADDVAEMRRQKQGRPQRLWKRTRQWLGQHSVLYRKLDYSPLGQLLHTAPRGVRQGQDPDHVFQDVHGKIVEFRPSVRQHALDLDDPKIQEGLRLTQLLLGDMHERCRAAGIRFVVALIPTKERVFADYLVRQEDPAIREVIARLLESEDRARAAIATFLAERGAEVVDVVPALQAVAGEARIYPRHTEGHPNEHGYRVIAETIARHLAASPGAPAVGS